MTFHASHNCGSFLQSFALQQFLIKNNFDAEIIDYSNDGQQQLYQVVFKNTSIKNILRNIILIPRRRILKNTYQNYEKFITTNLKLSKVKFSNYKELENYNFKYDIVICGSDQIWNVTIEDFDKSYLLPFISKKKKIAYAPSFGAKKMSNYLTTEKLEEYINYLKDFSLITVREENGKKWLKEMLNKEVPVVLDPTLLLEREDYKKIEKLYDKEISGKYIFYYSPSYNPQINKLVSKIAKKYKLKVVAWNPRSYYLKLMNFSNFYLPKEENPGVYLSLIRDAELVITTSFHGTIFSTIYQKKFWVIKNGEMYGDDDRVKTLINQVAISDRLIPFEYKDDFDYLAEVNYIQYKENIKKLKEFSKNILLRGINNDNETKNESII